MYKYKWKRVAWWMMLAVLLMGCLSNTALAGATNDQLYSQIKLSKTTLTISPLNTWTSLTVTNLQPGYEKVTWSVSPGSVADIDADTGVITPKVNGGRAVITAKGSLSGKSATCALVVRTIKLESLTLNAKNLTIAPNKQFRIKAVVKPANATYRALNWTLTSLNPPPDVQDQSKFDPETGIFTAGKMEGEQLVLTAKNQLGRSVSCRITVRSVPVSQVKFKKASFKVALNGSYDLSKQLVVLPSNAANAAVTWTSNNPKVATVDENGLVHVLDEGTVRILAASADNPNKYAICTLKCVSVRVTKLKLSATSAVADPGDTFELQTKVTPSNASFGTVSWSSKDESVATVNASGKVTVRKAGKTQIVATTDRGRVSASLTLRVRGGSMKTVKLSAIGDVTLGGDKKRVSKTDDYIKDGKTSYARFKALYDAKGQDYFFDKVKGVFAKDDITVANLECVLTDSTNAKSKPINLSGPPKYRTILQRSGIDVACMANNHTMDFHEAGRRDTMVNLKAVGVAYYGEGGGRTTIKNVNGVRMGFAGFTMPANRADVQKAVRALKRSNGCDIVVVSFHWTTSTEWTSSITGMERSMARYAVNCGADLVLGHHKHLLSGIEQYKGKMIVYDLGNFISLVRHVTQSGKYVSKDSMIYQQRFNVFEDGYVECAPPSIIPCMSSNTTDSFTGNAHIATGSDAQRVLDTIKSRTPSAYRDLVKTISGY